MQKWFCLVYSARIEVLKLMHTQAAETIFLLTCRPTLKRTWTVWSAASAWCSNNKDCKGLKYHDRLCCTESFPCFHLVHCLHIASMCFSTRKSKPAIYVLVSNRSLNILVTLEIKARYECQLSSNTWSFFIHKSWTLSWLKVVVFRGWLTGYLLSLRKTKSSSRAWMPCIVCHQTIGQDGETEEVRGGGGHALRRQAAGG